MVFNGNQAATIITLVLSGVLAETLGWESIFYIFGALGVIIGVFFAYFVHESPSVHPSISTVISQYSNLVLLTSYLLTDRVVFALWQYRLWSFQGRDTKLEWFLA